MEITKQQIAAIAEEQSLLVWSVLLDGCMQKEDVKNRLLKILTKHLSDEEKHQHCVDCAPEYGCWNGEKPCYKKPLTGNPPYKLHSETPIDFEHPTPDKSLEERILELYQMHSIEFHDRGRITTEMDLNGFKQAILTYTASLRRNHAAELQEWGEKLRVANMEVSEAHDWDTQFCDELVDGHRMGSGRFFPKVTETDERNAELLKIAEKLAEQMRQINKFAKYADAYKTTSQEGAFGVAVTLECNLAECLKLSGQGIATFNNFKLSLQPCANASSSQNQPKPEG